MKRKLIISIVLSGMVIVNLKGQEIDDLYFTAKDRAKLNSKAISAEINSSREKIASINPTDSYSARNVNPEYSSQLESNSSALPDDYFISDYRPTGLNSKLNDCNCSPYYSSAFNNPYYGNMGGFGSPYSNFYPNYWGSPFGFRPGFNWSMNYGWGYNPAFYSGLGYGYGSFWDPFYGNYWNPYYPYPTVIVVNPGGEGRQVAYQKRTSRSSSLNNNVNTTRPSTSSVATGNSRTSMTGRTRSSQPEYYEREWRRSQNNSNNRSYWNNANSNSRSDFNWNNSGSRSSGFSNQPTRSSFNSGSSGGSRSGVSSGSSGGSRTRGRNN